MSAFACLPAGMAFSQAEKNRLALDNEARLNRLQPAQKVNDGHAIYL